MAAPGTFKRGYQKPSTHQLLQTVPYRLRRKISASAVPASFATLCNNLSVFENDTYGDCVTAEECQNINTGANYVVPNADVLAFGQKYDLLNGSDLPTVLKLMETDGLPSGGTTYKDGPYAAVNMQSYEEMCAALVEFQASGGPPTQIKLGVAADQLEAAMDDSMPFGMFFNFKPDSNIDHCTAKVGFGTVAVCLAALNKFYSTNLGLPLGVDGTQPGLVHYTWGKYQVMNYSGLLNVSDGEAYIRNPSLVGVGPSPIVPPTPINPPVPPAPRPPCPRRATELLDAHPEWEQPLFQLLLDRALSGGAP